MFEQNIINEQTINLFKEIDKNFLNVSKGGDYYEERIWSLEGLEKHVFWEEQRKLAKELINQLKLIKID